MFRNYFKFGCFILLLFISVACSFEQQIVSNQSSSVNTPINQSSLSSPLSTPTTFQMLSPIIVPTPTSTPSPFPTSSPTMTHTPSPTKTPEPTPLPIPQVATIKSNAVAFIDDDRSLWVANMDGSGEKKLVDNLNASDIRFVWSPDGQWLAVRASSLFVISPDGKKIVELVAYDSKTGIKDFVWSPDSKKIAFVQSETGVELKHLAIVDIVTTNITYLLKEEIDIRENNLLAWSPDGKWLAYITGYRVKVINLAKDIILPIESLKFCQGGVILAIYWSVDSDSLAIWDIGNGRYTHGTACIVKLYGEGASLTLNKEGIDDSSPPFWSSNGDLYTVEVNFNPDDFYLKEEPRLLHFDKNGQLIEILNFVQDRGRIPKISPDGQWISSLMNGHIQFINLSERQIITHTLNSFLTHYSWSADSRNLLFLMNSRIYTFDVYTGKLNHITNNHRVGFYAASP